MCTFRTCASSGWTTHAWVVHGADGLDEVSSTGPTKVAALANGAVREFTIAPADIGIDQVSIDALRGGTPDENAASLRGVLTGDTGPYRDVVLLNAAAALVGGGHETLTTAAERAADSIADGVPWPLDRLVAITNGEAE